MLAGTIDLRRAEDEDIVAAMIAHELPGLSADRVPEKVESYDYLLRLRMDRVKAAAVQEQEKAVAVARAALAELEGTTAAALWLKDLDAFSAVWAKMRAAREAALAGGGGRKKEVGGKRVAAIKPKAVRA